MTVITSFDDNTKKLSIHTYSIFLFYKFKSHYLIKYLDVKC